MGAHTEFVLCLQPLSAKRIECCPTIVRVASRPVRFNSTRLQFNQARPQHIYILHCPPNDAQGPRHRNGHLSHPLMDVTIQNHDELEGIGSGTGFG